MQPVSLKERPDLIPDARASLLENGPFDFISNEENILNYVLLDEGRIIAGLDYSIGFDTADILFIYTVPERRREGLAEKLLSETSKVLKEKGISSVFLEVRSSNGPAENLYLKLGFSKAGIRKKYYDGVEDAIIMRKDL